MGGFSSNTEKKKSQDVSPLKIATKALGPAIRAIFVAATGTHNAVKTSTEKSH
jgi:hypothetical protein